MNRRSFLGKSTLLGMSLAAPTVRSAGRLGPSASRLRVVHMTDTHVFDERGCPAAMDIFLTRLAQVTPAPDLILHSGDVIMEAFAEKNPAVVDAQWNLWRGMVPRLPAPVHYCLGNHDIWGAEDRADKFYAKRRAMDELGMPHPYYRFERGGWTFLMLDSIQPQGGTSVQSYVPDFGEAQRRWLGEQLESIPSAGPVMICSHAPIVSAAIFDMARVRTPADAKPSAAGENPAMWMTRALLLHTDSVEVRRIVSGRTGPTLCVAGHLHLRERILYDGVEFFGGGAVCARWWREPVNKRSAAGFTIFDLEADGRWEQEFVSYTWN